MSLGILPSFIEPSIKPWLADDSAKWPVIEISKEIAAAAREKAGPSKQDTLDLIGKAAWNKFLGGSLQAKLGLWEWAVRATTTPEDGIRWITSDAGRAVVCAAHVYKADDGAVEVALMGWMHNGELMVLSEKNSPICKPPYRPAESLIELSEHLRTCAGLMAGSKQNRKIENATV